MRHVRSIRSTSRLLTVVAVAALVAGTVPSAVAHGRVSGSGAASAIPAATSRSATARGVTYADSTLPATTCSPSCDLYARQGSVNLTGGGSVPIWGYAANGSDPAGLPGPTLIVTQGTPVTITLHNIDLPVSTSLSLSQLPLIPDTTGIAAGPTTRAYTFTPGTAGTYLYEAGLTPTGPRQVAMGLYGALIVRPSSCTGCGYDGASAFDDESLLVLSEIDISFNDDPLAFDMAGYHPTHRLINGVSYPDTATIDSAPGHHVLLRYVNAGLLPHSMSLLGLRQTIIGVDGRQSARPMTVVAETIPAGSSMDALVSVSPSAAAGAKYAVFEAATHLDNDGALVADPPDETTPVAFGGMLAFIALAGGGPPGSPTTSGVTVTPNVTNGAATSDLAATIDAHGAATVTAAEYFVDAIGVDGTGCAMTGSFGAATVSLSNPVGAGSAPCADFATLSSGNHTFYVHGQDSNGAWGVVGSAVLNLDKTGPIVSGLALLPAITNGSVDVALGGTASDAATGGRAVTAAEYTIDGGAPTAISLGPPATDVNLSATILAGTVNLLSPGDHTVAVRAQDNLGNWGAQSTVMLSVDKAGPLASGVIATPNPTNGTFGVQGGTAGGFSERIDASVSDTTTGNHAIIDAEYFTDVIGADGTGGRMIPVAGTFSGPTAAIYAFIDLYAMGQLSAGSHAIYVHGKDAAGNWGSTAMGSILIDRVAPTFTSLSASPNPTNTSTSNNVAFTLTAVGATDAATSVVGGEWWEGTDPGPGLGTPFTGATSTTINFVALGWARGNHTVTARIMDAAHNWSATRSVTVNVVYPNNIFADGFESGNFAAWSSSVGTNSRISVTSVSAQAGTYKLGTTIVSGSSGYVQDSSPFVETTYHARFYLNPNTLSLNNTGRTIFLGLDGANATVFQVQIRNAGSGFQVAAIVSRAGGGGGTTTTNWYSIPSGTWTAIEIAWAAGGSASFSLSTAGTLRQTLTGLNTSAFRLETVRLGLQGALNGGISGTALFDSFVSTRNTVVGP